MPDTPPGVPPHSPARRAPAHEGTAAFLTGLPGPAPLPAAPPRRTGRARPAALASMLASLLAPAPGRGRRALALAAVAAAGLLLGAAASSGTALRPLRAAGTFLDFYCGVFALVSLSLTVMVGLLATDRAVLTPRHRVRAQAAHRALAFLAVGTLAMHLVSQLARHRVGAVQAFVPLSRHHLADYALGTLAFYLLLVAVAGGVARGRFAAARRPWIWRATHLTAYAAWPVGVAHGLRSGRAPAAWVTAGYLLCLAGVAVALAARPLLRPRGRRTP